jgi:type I restriction enzyme S subunit
VADKVEKVVDQSLKQAERLKQSILKKAFEGKLVPQDPSDEPAEKLLERIKAEKIKLTNNASKRNKLHGQKTRRVV